MLLESNHTYWSLALRVSLLGVLSYIVYRGVMYGCFFMEDTFPVCRMITSSDSGQNYNLLLHTEGRIGDREALGYHPPRDYEAASKELLADILISDSGSLEQALSLYRDAYALERVERVRTKIDLLSSTGQTASQGERLDLPDKQTERVEISSGGLDALEQAEKRIRSDHDDRARYISPISSDKILEDTILFLDIDTPRIDW